MNEKNIQAHNSQEDDDLEIPEFDFENALPNPYAERYRQGVIVTVFKTNGSKETYVRLDEDIAESFSSSKLVNDALRDAMKREAKFGKKAA